MIKNILLGFFALAALALAALIVLDRLGDRSTDPLVRCANHVAQHRLMLRLFLETESAKLPEALDAREALRAVLKELKSETASWLDTELAACPEPYARRRSIGYVYFGSGLAAEVVREKKALVLLCPAESHEGRWACGLAGGEEGLELFLGDGAQALELLSRAVRDGERGEVAYTKDALHALRDERDRRRARLGRE